MHAELVGYLMQELGDYMVPDRMGADVTPNELWAANKTLIVTYGNTPNHAFNSLLWSEVEHAWGDARTRQELYAFLTGTFILECSMQYKSCTMNNLFLLIHILKSFDSANMRSRSERGTKSLWAAMTHLTPSAWQFLSKSTGGFRFLSDSIAREVTYY